MRRSVKATLPFLAAACLIGGSASAECPQFNSALPTVIVTDVTPAGAPDITANFFVYTNAFDLVDYIDFGSTGLTDSRFAFNEFTVGSSTPSTGSNRIYSINGDLGDAAVPTTAAAVDTASNTSGGSVATEGVLTFRNVKLSPVGGEPFATPAPADVTAPGNTRNITLYLIAPSSSATCFLNANIDVASFQVITEVGSAGSPDRLTGSSCSFTPFQTYATFAPGWSYGSLGGGTVSLTPAGTLTTPATVPGYSGDAPAGTTAIGFTASVASTGPSTWRHNLGTALSADTLYRVRSTWSSNVATPGAGNSNWVRLRFGGDFFAENGQAEQGYEREGAAFPVTGSPRAQSLYHWVRSASAGSSLPGGSDEPALNFDLNDASTTIAGHLTTLSSLSIDSTTRDCLGAGTVLRNFGATSVSNADGETPSATGLAAFSAGNTTTGALVDVAGSVTMATSFTSPVNGAANLTFTPSGSIGLPDQTGFAAVFQSGASAITIDQTKIYAIDTWVSAPVAPNLTTSRLPWVRHRWTADPIGNNQGQIYTVQYNLNPDQNFDGTADNGNGLTTANSSVHYASFWQPDFNTGVQPLTGYNWFVDFIFNRNGATAVKPNGTLSLERVTITQYDQPLF